MNLISLLLSESKGIVTLVAVTCLLAGVSNAGLLAIINSALSGSTLPAAYLIAGFCALCVVTLGCRVLSNSLLSRLSQGSIFKLRMNLSRQILDAPLIRLEEFGSSRLLAALNDDVPTIAFALVGIPPFLMNIATVLGCLIYLGWLSRPALLALLGFMVLGVVSYQFLMTRALKYMAMAREHGNALYGHFRALTDGSKELKIHSLRREAFLTQKLRVTALTLRRLIVVGDTVLSAAMGWGQLLIFIFIGLLLFAFSFGDRHVMTGFALVTIFLTTPIESILNTFPTMGRAGISLKKVEELGLTLNRFHEGNITAPAARPATWSRLELDGVTHSYVREKEESVFTVGPINLSFRPGELVFLTGGNGSGKTTLAKLLLGLYIPESGEVRLDGRPVTDENRDEYRQLFSVVFSDFYLFEDLIGLEAEGLDAQALKYLEELHLDHKVRVEGGAFSTTALSQGQRKRLALLAAYLEDRPIYLFDEWAADQDPTFKGIFYRELLPRLKERGKLTLVISHDDHYYHVADRLIKLDDGQLEFDRSIPGAGLEHDGLDEKKRAVGLTP